MTPKWDHIKEIEIELSSRCNAACPGCKRTAMLNRDEYFSQEDITLEQFKHMFDDYDFHGMQLKFCGVLGDPVVNPDLMEISRYAMSKNATLQVSTNTGLRSTKWWKDYAELSKEFDNKLEVAFAIDGLEGTNHLYRVGVVWDKVWKNFTTYVKAGGRARWNWIAFDHNAHDLEQAKQISNDLGVPFFIRKSWKNFNPWIVPKKNAKKNKITKEYSVVTSSTNPLSHPEAKKNLTFKKKLKEQLYNDMDMSNIDCKYTHWKQLFISSMKQLWPCCFLHDELFNGTKGSPLESIFKKYGNDWNDLTKHSINDILEHIWYRETLVDSWKKSHNMHQPRCYKSCGDNGARHVIITHENKQEVKHEK
jgi:MoaA/NifB/PqqE/SkfB family radical SAM enzyme